jgi:hypothetical protein
MTELEAVKREWDEARAREEALRQQLMAAAVLLGGEGGRVLIVRGGGLTPWRLIADWAAAVEEEDRLGWRHLALIMPDDEDDFGL